MNIKKILLLVMSLCLVVGCSTKPEANVPTETPKVESKTLEITTAGTYNEGSKYDEIMIFSENVVLEETKAKNIIIDEQVKDGDVTLKNVDVTSLLSINGGGINSIHIESSNINAINVDRKESVVRVVVSKDTNVDLIDVVSKSNMEISGNVKSININEGAVDSNVVIETSAVLSELTLKATTETQINGSIDKLSIEAISNVVINAEVNEVLVKENAKDTKIELSENAKVNTVATDTTLEVNGSGAIGEVIAKDNNQVTGNIEADKVTVNKNPTESMSGTANVEPTVEPTVKPTSTPRPTVRPTAKPTAKPTATPSVVPTANPETPKPKPTPTPVPKPEKKIEVELLEVGIANGKNGRKLKIVFKDLSSLENASRIKIDGITEGVVDINSLTEKVQKLTDDSTLTEADNRTLFFTDEAMDKLVGLENANFTVSLYTADSNEPSYSKKVLLILVNSIEQDENGNLYFCTDTVNFANLLNEPILFTGGAAQGLELASADFVVDPTNNKNAYIPLATLVNKKAPENTRFDISSGGSIVKKSDNSWVNMSFLVNKGYFLEYKVEPLSLMEVDGNKRIKIKYSEGNESTAAAILIKDSTGTVLRGEGINYMYLFTDYVEEGDYFLIKDECMKQLSGTVTVRLFGYGTLGNLETVKANWEGTIDLPTPDEGPTE